MKAPWSLLIFVTGLSVDVPGQQRLCGPHPGAAFCRMMGDSLTEGHNPSMSETGDQKKGYGYHRQLAKGRIWPDPNPE